MQDVITLLLAKGAKLNARDNDGWTAMHYIGQSRFVTKEIVNILIQAGADTNARNDKGQTPLDVAIRAGNDTVSARLIGAGARKSM